jgi:hypothetical protein
MKVKMVQRLVQEYQSMKDEQGYTRDSPEEVSRVQS